MLRSAEHGNVLLCRASFLQTHGTEPVLDKTHADTRQSKLSRQSITRHTAQKVYSAKHMQTHGKVNLWSPRRTSARRRFMVLLKMTFPCASLMGHTAMLCLPCGYPLCTRQSLILYFFSISFFPCFLSFFILLLMFVCHKIFLLIY